VRFTRGALRKRDGVELRHRRAAELALGNPARGGLETSVADAAAVQRRALERSEQSIVERNRGGCSDCPDDDAARWIARPGEAWSARDRNQEGRDCRPDDRSAPLRKTTRCLRCSADRNPTPES
jgi:hypothetical protein